MRLKLWVHKDNFGFSAWDWIPFHPNFLFCFNIIGRMHRVTPLKHLCKASVVSSVSTELCQVDMHLLLHKLRMFLLKTFLTYRYIGQAAKIFIVGYMGPPGCKCDMLESVSPISPPGPGLISKGNHFRCFPSMNSLTSLLKRDTQTL